jgi:hypothetical protein
VPQQTSWWQRAFAVDLRSLAAFRVGLGSIVVADALLRTRDLGPMFSVTGMLPPAVIRSFYDDPCAWSLALAIDADWWGAVVLAGEAAAGLFLAAGCGTRFATAAAWVAVVSVLRRTAPATNAGDAWLACLLFWGMFLPLGATWSYDVPRGRRGAVGSTASTLLVLQIAAVYLAAGLSKWNPAWLTGDAIRFALSVHDHGTPLGDRLFAGGWLARPVAWSVLALELVGPILLLAWPAVRIRLVLCGLFMLFHAASCLTMSVGLFGYVGIVAWLPLLPAEVWNTVDPGPPVDSPCRVGTGSQAGRWLCLTAGGLALVSLIHDITPWRDRPLPRPVASLVHAFCMHQEWAMFGSVLPQEQWAYARAELADGRVVDLLRGGRPLEAERPAGGFWSLPHHRWHKFMWALQRPRYRCFAAPTAAALVRDWNRRHASGERVERLELRFARLGRTPEDDTLHDLLLAAWPPRDPAGAGNLERLIEGLDAANRAGDRAAAVEGQDPADVD